MMPSMRVSFLLLRPHRKYKIAAANTTSVSIILKALEVKPPKISVGNPSTMQILKMLVPIILPIARLCSPFLDALTVITSSGKEVPITTIVIAMTFWLMCNSCASATALSTARSLARAIKTKVIIYKIERPKVYFE